MPSIVKRHRLGSWTCPSGNNCVVDYVEVSDGYTSIAIAWDEPPPLEPKDEEFYVAVIRPAVIRLVHEHLGFAGHALVVDL